MQSTRDLFFFFLRPVSFQCINMDKGDSHHHHLLSATELRWFQQNSSKKPPKLGPYQRKSQGSVRAALPMPTARMGTRGGRSVPFLKGGDGPVAHGILYPLGQATACTPASSIAPSWHRPFPASLAQPSPALCWVNNGLDEERPAQNPPPPQGSSLADGL